MEDTVNARNRIQRTPRTIRFQLLATINLVLVVFAAAALTYDYRHEMYARLDRKRIALEEEAKTLLPAVSQMWDARPERVRQYIDSVCARMRESDSPGHHIVIEIGDNVIQATAHHRESKAIVAAMRRAEAPDYVSPLNNTELIVGTFARDDVTVYVSESVDNVYTSVVGDILRRLASFL